MCTEIDLELLKGWRCPDWDGNAATTGLAKGETTQCGGHKAYAEVRVCSAEIADVRLYVSRPRGVCGLSGYLDVCVLGPIQAQLKWSSWSAPSWPASSCCVKFRKCAGLWHSW